MSRQERVYLHLTCTIKEEASFRKPVQCGGLYWGKPQQCALYVPTWGGGAHSAGLKEQSAKSAPTERGKSFSMA